MSEENGENKPAFETVSFEAKEYRKNRFRPSIWKTTLTSDAAEFVLSGVEERFVLPRANAQEHVRLLNELVSAGNIVINVEEHTYSFNITGKNLSAFRIWLKGDKTKEEIQVELNTRLRNTGVGLILLGLLNLSCRDPFLTVWGIVVIVGGILSLSIKKREMLIINGLIGLLAGAIYIISAWNGMLIFDYTKANWLVTGLLVFGISLIGWGIRESLQIDDFAILAKRPPQPKRLNLSKPENKKVDVGLLIVVILLVGILLVILGGILGEQFGWW